MVSMAAQTTCFQIETDVSRKVYISGIHIVRILVVLSEKIESRFTRNKATIFFPGSTFCLANHIGCSF